MRSVIFNLLIVLAVVSGVVISVFATREQPPYLNAFDIPEGSVRVKKVGLHWCTFEWEGHRYAQHVSRSTRNGCSYETIHICHPEMEAIFP